MPGPPSDTNSIFSWSDVHIHLQSHLNKEDATTLLRNGRLQGATRFVCPGTFPGDWEEIVGLSQQDDALFPALGVHPWYVQKIGHDWESQLVALLEQTRPLNLFRPVLGEIGLDFAVRNVDRTQQMECFERQLTIAHKKSLPVMLHCVRAADQIYESMKKVSVPLILLHSFHGTIHQAARFVEWNNVYFSFRVDQILSHHKNVLDIIGGIPLDRILLESDVPVTEESKLPSSENGSIRSCESCQRSLLPLLARAVEELREESAQVFMRQLRANEERFFSLWPQWTQTAGPS